MDHTTQVLNDLFQVREKLHLHSNKHGSDFLINTDIQWCEEIIGIFIANQYSIKNPIPVSEAEYISNTIKTIYKAYKNFN